MIQVRCAGRGPKFEHFYICETRPQGSTAIYMYGPATDEVVLESPSASRSIGGDLHIAMSMPSADFNGDLKPDVAVRYGKHIHIFLSTERRGRLPISDPYAVIECHVWRRDHLAMAERCAWLTCTWTEEKK